jgi:hypothetical protein
MSNKLKIGVYKLVPFVETSKLTNKQKIINKYKLKYNIPIETEQSKTDEENDLSENSFKTINNETVTYYYAKYVEKGYVKYNKNFDDDEYSLDFVDPSSCKFKITKNKMRVKDDIMVNFYRDNLSSYFITSSLKIPMMHCSVIHMGQNMVENLFNLYLHFNIVDNHNVKSYEEFLDKKIKGFYTITLEYPDRTETEPYNKFTNFDDVVLFWINMFENDRMINIIEKELNDKKEILLKEYESKIKDNQNIPKKIIKFDDLVTQYEENDRDISKVDITPVDNSGI